MDEFLAIIRNLQHNLIQIEGIKMIIHFWINNKQESEKLKDKFY